MLPIELSIEGLYSYQEKQVIDFTKLTAAGLFGIFGATGSGKSSILEAISFVLYGETERMNRNGRAYNMLNLKSNRATIEFVFLNWENKKFKVVRGFRRNSKQFDIVNPTDTIFYEENQGEWIPIEKNAEQILDLTYTNFKRTIIIPQGQFREFIELGEKDRTAMMEEVFQLHRFDLQSKTKNLWSISDGKLKELKGRLSMYEEVSDTLLIEQKTIQNEVEERVKQSEVTYNSVLVSYQQMKRIQDRLENLAKKKVEFSKLEAEKETYEKLHQKIEEYQRVTTIFSPLLKDKKRLKEEVEKLQNEKETLQDGLKKMNVSFQHKTDDLEKIQSYYQQLTSKRIEESDLEFLRLIALSKKQLQQKITTIQQSKEKVIVLNKKKDQIISEIQILQTNILLLKKEIIDSVILVEVSDWYNKKKSKEENLQKEETRYGIYQQELKLLTDKFAEQQTTMETYEATYQNQILEQEQLLASVQEQISQLAIQQKLAAFTHTLHDEAACPLCGSEDHPHILEVGNVDELLKKEEEKIKSLNTIIQTIRNKKSKADKLAVAWMEKTKQIQETKKIIEILKDEHRSFIQSFHWPSFQPDNFEGFEKIKATSNQHTIQLKAIEEQWTQLQEAKENVQVELEDSERKLRELTIAENNLLTEINSNSRNIKLLSISDFEELSIQQLEERRAELISKNDSVEKQFQQINSELHEIKISIAGKESLLNNTTLRTNEITQLQTKNNQLIEEMLSEQSRELSDVENVLSKVLDIPKLQAEVQNYRVEYQTVRSQIKAIEEQLQDEIQSLTFSSELFVETEKNLLEATERFEQNKKELTIIESKISQLEAKIKEKKELSQQFETLQKRVDNLLLLLNLFNGKGFVNFISTIYLRQLVQMANLRFHRMTRNQLSLVINDKNEFEIIDYLNEGKTRSVRTLSGGQAFQVSLSLALALAESVQAKSKISQNFFFIDEGFGTQDNESVNLVFETLLNLNKENKVVGIISHVEELKERIPISLMIVKDNVKGSLII